jgi:hypothetical protein
LPKTAHHDRVNIDALMMPQGARELSCATSKSERTQRPHFAAEFLTDNKSGGGQRRASSGLHGSPAAVRVYVVALDSASCGCAIRSAD